MDITHSEDRLTPGGICVRRSPFLSLRARELEERAKVPIVGSDKCGDVCVAILVIAAQEASAPRQRIGFEVPHHRDVREQLFP